MGFYPKHGYVEIEDNIMRKELKNYNKRTGVANENGAGNAYQHVYGV